MNFLKSCRKVVGVGRNYLYLSTDKNPLKLFRAHAKELGNTASMTEPVIFFKPPSSFVQPPGKILLPSSSVDVQHEVELALVIGRKGARISKDKAMDHVAGYALALDMTERRMQRLASSKGEPWAIAKGYDTFLPISDMIPSNKIKDPSNVDLWCKVDGELRQKGNTKDMIFKVDWLISYISRIMTLEEGDVILTGTPSGVGPVKDGQKVSCGMLYEGKTLSEFTIEAKAAK